MTTPGTPDDELAAALIQISGHAERIASLDTREASHHRDMAARLTVLADDTASASTGTDAIAAAVTRHAAVAEALGALDQQVASLARQLAELADAKDESDPRPYQPVPPPRWWQLTGPERDAAADRLRAWVDQIYRPGYGQLAAALPPCWEHHPLCLYTLDWLSELWSVLYIGGHRTSRTLAAQAEWQTRLLPAAADQMASEATSCRHSTGNPPPLAAVERTRFPRPAAPPETRHA